MPKAYMVVSYQSISDPQKLAAYAKLLQPGAMASFGPRILARGNAAAAYERGLKERVVIVEYPSLEKAIAAHASARPRRSIDQSPASRPKSRPAVVSCVNKPVGEFHLTRKFFRRSRMFAVTE